jgi:phosphatidylglycerol---prolipoprotein diacylglyceryl transferase
MSPILFSINGLQIRYFGVFYAVGLVFLFILVKKNTKNARIAMTRDELMNWLIIVFFYGLIGARAVYILFNLDYYFSPGEKWYEFLAIWNGGLALNGGIAFSAFTLWILCDIKNISFSAFSDQIAAPLLLTFALVSIGSFINSGSMDLLNSSENHTLISVLAGKTGSQGPIYHPMELYGSALYIVGFVLLSLVGTAGFRSGFLITSCLLYYSMVQIILSRLEQGELILFGIDESLLAGIVGTILSLLLITARRLFRKRSAEKKQYPSTRKWKV